MTLPSAAHIMSAQARIDPAFLDTPAFSLPELTEAIGVDVLFKDERVTPIGSFKGRGADLLVQSYPEHQAFVCASAGNFGQGVAWAARRRGSAVTVFAAESAIRCKIEAMEELGATVMLCGGDFDEAKAASRDYARRTGGTFVEDGAHPEIAEGAGTIAKELTDAGHEFDAVYVPLGNGSLVAGMGCWLKHNNRDVRVVAVAAAGAPAMAHAVLGRPFEGAPCDTIADGIAVRVPVPEAVTACRAVVDEILLVDDEEIRSAMALIEKLTNSVVEPAGAVGLAGVLNHATRLSGARVAVPICGRNRDPADSRFAWSSFTSGRARPRAEA
jgi:threonine dehydratase